MNSLLINNVVIYDGKKEYNTEQVLKDSQLIRLANRVPDLSKITTLVDKINNEGGILYITTNSLRDTYTVDLRNVSPALYDDFLRLRT